MSLNSQKSNREVKKSPGGDSWQNDSSKSKTKGSQHGSETGDTRFRDSGTVKKTVGWAGDVKVEDAQIFTGVTKRKRIRNDYIRGIAWVKQFGDSWIGVVRDGAEEGYWL